MKTPLVSVCIPTYKGAEFLGAAIDSVLTQTYSNLEVWIIDDNSPDNTKALVSLYPDPRINYVRNEKNLGPQDNWNRCLTFARGKYYKLLPHDDLLTPDSIEEQVKVLEADQDGQIALVFGSRQIIAPDGEILMTRGLSRAKAGRINGVDLIKRTVRAGANLIGEPGNGLFRRELIEKVGFYDASHPYLVDLDYWFRVLLFGDAYYTATQSSSFRISSGSWSVAIGNNQHADFNGFVDKFYQDTRFGLSSNDRTVSRIMARINTVARAAVYWYLFRVKKG